MQCQLLQEHLCDSLKLHPQKDSLSAHCSLQTVADGVSHADKAGHAAVLVVQETLAVLLGHEMLQYSEEIKVAQRLLHQLTLHTHTQEHVTRGLQTRKGLPEEHVKVIHLYNYQHLDSTRVLE